MWENRYVETQSVKITGRPFRETKGSNLLDFANELIQDGYSVRLTDDGFFADRMRFLNDAPVIDSHSVQENIQDMTNENLAGSASEKEPEAYP